MFIIKVIKIAIECFRTIIKLKERLMTLKKVKRCNVDCIPKNGGVIETGRSQSGNKNIIFTVNISENIY